jgi:phosphoribosylanthranilate isomerase
MCHPPPYKSPYSGSSRTPRLRVKNKSMNLFFSTTPAMPKICGITSWEDAVPAIESGAGALGFNFYPPSPRSIPHDADLGWIRDLGDAYPDIARIAVVVNPDEVLLRKLRGAKCFDAIQFHGDESPDFCSAEGGSFDYWIKALRVRSEEDLAIAENFKTPFLLLDAAVTGSYGGSGQTLDWSLAATFVAEHPERRVILAGGLTPENVATAVTQVFPHAVDVASGVESSPGQKDPEKVRGFIIAALS